LLDQSWQIHPFDRFDRSINGRTPESAPNPSRSKMAGSKNDDDDVFCIE
jgi:hypothetical protein